MMKRTLILASVLLLPILTAACNTMEGAGEDLSAGGKKLENSAERHKNY